jgi:hypothetical protein
MKTLSIWAHYHPWAARIAIIVSAVILMCIAILAGLLSYDAGHVMNSASPWISTLLIFILCAVYPNKQNKRYKIYQVRKALDVCLVISSFLLFASTSNQYAASGYRTQQVGSLAASSFSSSSLSKPVKPNFRQQKRVVKQWLKALREMYKKASPTSKTLLILLTVLVAVSLIILIAALSCNIACTSSAAIAWIVFLFGSAGVILLGRMVIHRIRRGPKHKSKAETNTDI